MYVYTLSSGSASLCWSKFRGGAVVASVLASLHSSGCSWHRWFFKSRALLCRESVLLPDDVCFGGPFLVQAQDVFAAGRPQLLEHGKFVAPFAVDRCAEGGALARHVLEGQHLQEAFGLAFVVQLGEVAVRPNEDLLAVVAGLVERFDAQAVGRKRLVGGGVVLDEHLKPVKVAHKPDDGGQRDGQAEIEQRAGHGHVCESKLRWPNFIEHFKVWSISNFLLRCPKRRQDVQLDGVARDVQHDVHCHCQPGSPAER